MTRAEAERMMLELQLAQGLNGARWSRQPETRSAEAERRHERTAMAIALMDFDVEEAL